MRELLRRNFASSSLSEFARFIEIPGARTSQNADEGWTEDDWNDLAKPIVFTPVESSLVKHHAVILDELQLCMETANGRLMILAPPGSAKSTYAIAVACPWAMGKWPGYRLIVTSYATKLARKQSRKALQVVRQPAYRSIWPEMPEPRRDVAAAEEWGMTNGSELMAAGILAGITGNRANGAICDDLIAGREEAESPTVRAKIMEAYRDDVESRLLPNGWICLINTRWHEEDPSGSILPDDYGGQSGAVVCKDGRTWRVLNMPAKAEHPDDPVGRAIGEYLWPEWFPKEHWQFFENDPTAQRRWMSLYQGRPTGASGDDFDEADALWYEIDELPKELTIYGASDFAVKELDKEKKAANRMDFTEHGVIGMDVKGDIWLLDWWSGQKETDVSIDAFLELVRQWKPFKWWDEGGVIDTAIRPAVRRRMRELTEQRDERGKSRGSAYVSLDSLPRIADKRAKCQSFAARFQARTTHWPRGQAWAKRVLAQLTGFPGARYDDAYDVCGLLGRGIDVMLEADKPKEARPMGPKPFTGAWVEYEEPKPGPRYR